MATQQVKCQCGAVFAACAVPDCFEDKDWMKSIRQYSKSGCEIIMVENGVQFSPCTCDYGKLRRGEIKFLPDPKQTNLF